MGRLWATLLAAACVGCSPDQSASPLPGDPQSFEALSFAQDTTPQQVEFASDEQLVADAVLRYILTSAAMQSTVESYGTPGANELCLQSGGAKWPAPEFSATANYKVHLGQVPTIENGADQNRVLGLRLEQHAVDPSSHTLTGTADVCVGIFNAGGSSNGGVVGGCLGEFKASRSDTGWEVELVGLLDP